MRACGLERDADDGDDGAGAAAGVAARSLDEVDHPDPHLTRVISRSEEKNSPLSLFHYLLGNSLENRTERARDAVSFLFLSPYERRRWRH